MKKLALGVVSLAVVGGLFVAFSGEAPASDPVADVAVDQKVSKRVPVRQAQGETRYVKPKERTDAPSKPARGAGEPTEAEVRAAPFVVFSSRAAPRWQGVSIELRRLGHDDLADEAWSMAGWIRGQRSDAERDDVAILEAQQDLLERVQALPDLDGAAQTQLASVTETVTGYGEARAALE